jgi:hypothetical protein
VISADWSWRFGFGPPERNLLQAQLFVRYNWHESIYKDNVAGFDSHVQNWSVNTGINFSLF